MKPSGVFKVKWRVRYLVLQMHPDKLDGQQWTQFRLIMGATPPPHERWSLSPCISRSGGAAYSLCVCCAVSLSCVQHFGTPWTGQAPLSMRILQARILEWVACPPPGDPTGLLHCGWILCHLSHQKSPIILEWVAYPFSYLLPNPGIQLGSPAVQADPLPAELPGNPHVLY